MRISDWSSDVCSSDLLAYPLDRGFLILGHEPPAVRAEHLDRAIARLVRHAARSLHPIAEIDIGQAHRARAQDVIHDDEIAEAVALGMVDRKSTRLNSSH